MFCVGWSSPQASKAFSKAFMHRHGIPTAAFATFTDHAAALAYIRALPDSPPSIVIKASGLAAGKGVILPQSLAEAEVALAGIMCARDFGAAGDEVVIEQLLVGEEVSCLAFTDGERVALLPPAQDHKRVGDGDTGLNTYVIEAKKMTFCSPGKERCSCFAEFDFHFFYLFCKIS